MYLDVEFQTFAVNQSVEVSAGDADDPRPSLPAARRNCVRVSHYTGRISKKGMAQNSKNMMNPFTSYSHMWARNILNII